MRPSEQASHVATAPQQLTRKPGLADPSLTNEQYKAELSRGRSRKLIFKHPQLPTPPNELEAR